MSDSMDEMLTAQDVLLKTLALTTSFSWTRQALQRLMSLEKVATSLGNPAAPRDKGDLIPLTSSYIEFPKEPPLPRISLNKEMSLATSLRNLYDLHNTFESTLYSLQDFVDSESRISPECHAQIVQQMLSMPIFFHHSARVLGRIAEWLKRSNCAFIADHSSRLINKLCMKQRAAQRALESVHTLLHQVSLPTPPIPPRPPTVGELMSRLGLSESISPRILSDPGLDEPVDVFLGPNHNLTTSECLNGPGTSGQPGTTDTDYKVFISHAGEDKRSIGRPLWRRLQHKGIKTFLDETELRAGDNAPFCMKLAMETADICIVILSPEYAAKKWPMKELDCFLRRLTEADDNETFGPVLIPVFYRLSVSECGQDSIFQTIDSLGQRVFFRWGFFDREARKETSVKEVLRLLRELKCRTGIENHHNATNETTQDAHERRGRLLDDITKAVEEAHARLPSPSPSVLFPQ